MIECIGVLTVTDIRQHSIRVYRHEEKTLKARVTCRPLFCDLSHTATASVCVHTHAFSHSTVFFFFRYIIHTMLLGIPCCVCVSPPLTHTHTFFFVVVLFFFVVCNLIHSHLTVNRATRCALCIRLSSTLAGVYIQCQHGENGYREWTIDLFVISHAFFCVVNCGGERSTGRSSLFFFKKNELKINETT